MPDSNGTKTTGIEPLDVALNQHCSLLRTLLKELGVHEVATNEPYVLRKEPFLLGEVKREVWDL